MLKLSLGRLIVSCGASSPRLVCIQASYILLYGAATVSISEGPTWKGSTSLLFRVPLVMDELGDHAG